MNRAVLTILGVLGSAGLLLGALYFQYFQGLLPCQLCYWQRYGHFGALAIGVIALAVPNRILLALAALSALSSSVIAIFHSGVERQGWEGIQMVGRDYRLRHHRRERGHQRARGDHERADGALRPDPLGVVWPVDGQLQRRGLCRDRRSLSHGDARAALSLRQIQTTGPAPSPLPDVL